MKKGDYTPAFNKEYDEFIKRLIAARKEAKLSQEEVSKQLGLYRSFFL